MGFSICWRINLKLWNKTFVNIIYLGMGRLAKDILYTKVTFEEKEYYVGQIQNNDNLKHFIIDAEDYESVKIHYWHYQSNAYISSAYLSPHDGKRKEVYLHNFVMGRLEFPGKGAIESIDHINNIGMDNRKVNLRLITQTQQNYNTKRRARVTVLPDNCGILADDIPRNIYYMKPNGHHGDRFVIELKGLPDGDMEWKSTSSKSISLLEKLNQAKAKLIELYSIHNLHQQDESDFKKKLADEYNQILELATMSSV